MLLLLFACAPEDTTKPDHDETGALDTGADDSADEDTETGETADPETGESGETTPPAPTDWTLDDAHLVITPSGTDPYPTTRTGHLDGDGILDLIVVLEDDDRFGRDRGLALVYFGPVAGELAFADADVAIAGSGELALKDIDVLGDLDGDGGAEIVAMGDDDGFLLRSDQLVPGAVLGAADGVGAWGYEMASEAWDDIDGDGIAEVLYGDEQARVWDEDWFDCGALVAYSGADLLAGVWTALFDTRESYAEDYVGAEILVLDDRDGDGFGEIAASDDHGWLVWHSSDLLAARYDVAQRITGVHSPVRAGDVDGDGLDDLFVDAGDGIGIVHATAGDVDGADLPALGFSIHSLGDLSAFGDLDGDGLTEVLAAVANTAARISGATIVSGGTLDPAAPDWAIDMTGRGAGARADADGGVWITLATASPWSVGVYGLRTEPGAGLVDIDTATTSYFERAPYLPGTSAPVWADVDGDGARDLVLLGMSTPESTAVLDAARVAAGGTVPACVDACTLVPGEAGLTPDLDGDGLEELFVCTDTETWRYPLAAARDGFDTPLARVWDTSLDWVRDPFAQDVDGDGVPDPRYLFGVVSGAGLVGTFTEADRLSWDGEQHLGDIDGDGHGDVVARWSDADVVLSGADLHDGALIEDAAFAFYYGSDAHDPATRPTDVDGDGRMDVPVVFGEVAGWIPGSVRSATETAVTLGVSGIEETASIWAVPSGAPTRMLAVGRFDGAWELRVWTVDEARLYEPAEATVRIERPDDVALSVAWAGPDPLGGDGIAALVSLYANDGGVDSVRLYRFP